MSTVTVRKVGRPNKYPWTEWFNGQEHALVFGKDLECGLPTFRTNLSRHAARCKVKVTTRTTVTKQRGGKSVLTIFLKASPIHAKKGQRKSLRGS